MGALAVLCIIAVVAAAVWSLSSAIHEADVKRLKRQHQQDMGEVIQLAMSLAGDRLEEIRRMFDALR